MLLTQTPSTLSVRRICVKRSLQSSRGGAATVQGLSACRELCCQLCKVCDTTGLWFVPARVVDGSSASRREESRSNIKRAEVKTSVKNNENVSAVTDSCVIHFH